MTDTIRDYQCKICGRSGQVPVPDEFKDQHNLEWWLSLLTCNPCADYREQKVKLTDRIVRLALARRTAEQTNDKTEAVRRISGMMEYHLRALRELIGSYFRREVVHEEAWREQIERDASLALIVINRMEKAIREQPTEPETNERRDPLESAILL